MSVIAISIFWTILGAILLRFHFVPSKLPKLIGRSLYWLGLPVQIFALAYKSNFAKDIWLPPVTTIQVLLLGLLLASLSLYYLKPLIHHLLNNKILDKFYPRNRSSQGSFILASMLGSTGYLGMSVVPAFVNRDYAGWIALYGVTHILLGSYGLGVFLASYFGRMQQENRWWIQVRDLLSVPSLWAFAIGWCSRDLAFPTIIESGLQTCVSLVIPGAFLLTGMQLIQLQGVKSLQEALLPATLKMLVLPLLAGLGLTLTGVTGDARLTLVLMSGMPTANTNLILAEEYNLDRQLAASSILLTTVMLPLMIPFWEVLFK